MNDRAAISREAERPRHTKVIRPTRPWLGSVPGNFRALIAYSGLFRVMVATRLKIRYRNSVLGWLWAVLQPLALMLLYAAIFSHAVGYSTAPTPYPLFVMAGLLPWSFCSTSMSTAAGGMLSHHALMAKVYFPREIVTLSYVAAAAFDFLIALLLLLAMMPFYGVPISPPVLWVFPIMAIVALHVAGICLLLSALQVHIRDINVALPLLLQIFMFTAPVVYPASIVPLAYRTLYWANPLAILVDDFRGAVLGGGAPGGAGLFYCALSGCAVFILGYASFKRLEAGIVDAM